MSLPRLASCGASICTADEFGPHEHKDGIVTFEDGGKRVAEKFKTATSPDYAHEG